MAFKHFDRTVSNMKRSCLLVKIFFFVFLSISLQKQIKAMKTHKCVTQTTQKGLNKKFTKKNEKM